MWNRKALKRQGKAAFRRNYWKCVLVALLLCTLSVGALTNSGTISLNLGDGEGTYTEYEENTGSDFDGWEYKDDFSGAGRESSDSNGFGSGTPGNPGSNGFQEIPDDVQSVLPEEDESSAAGSILAVLLAGILGILSLAVLLLLRVFVGNPLEIGCKRFFLMNLRQEAGQAKEVAYVFDNGWKNAGWILFFRDLYLVLWSLLLIIPGIVKSYEYRMIPYLLAEDPAMPKKQAFAMSKQLMRGQKWKTFVLDLSFIGWHLLSLITIGIVGIFYTERYMYSTSAALYAALRYGRPQSTPLDPEENMAEEAPDVLPIEEKSEVKEDF